MFSLFNIINKLDFIWPWKGSFPCLDFCIVHIQCLYRSGFDPIYLCNLECYTVLGTWL